MILEKNVFRNIILAEYFLTGTQVGLTGARIFFYKGSLSRGWLCQSVARFQFTGFGLHSRVN